MKVTKEQLSEMIKKEVKNALNELTTKSFNTSKEYLNSLSVSDKAKIKSSGKSYIYFNTNPDGKIHSHSLENTVRRSSAQKQDKYISVKEIK